MHTYSELIYSEPTINKLAKQAAYIAITEHYEYEYEYGDFMTSGLRKS